MIFVDQPNGQGISFFVFLSFHKFYSFGYFTIWAVVQNFSFPIGRPIPLFPVLRLLRDTGVFVGP